MIGAELADELSTIADAYCADTREAWRMARFVNANMVAILAALRSERPAVDAGAEVDDAVLNRCAVAARDATAGTDAEGLGFWRIIARAVLNAAALAAAQEG